MKSSHVCLVIKISYFFLVNFHFCVWTCGVEKIGLPILSLSGLREGFGSTHMADTVFGIDYNFFWKFRIKTKLFTEQSLRDLRWHTFGPVLDQWFPIGLFTISDRLFFEK